MKAQVVLALTSAILVTGMITGMAWTGSYDLEIFVSLWVLAMCMGVLVLSPRNVKPVHFSRLNRIVAVGFIVFFMFVALHALSLVD